MKKVALGKGLEALIGQPADQVMDEAITVKMVSTSDIIGNEYQPRSNFNPEALEDLKKSIKERGIIQPLLVSKQKDKFRLIAGERRLRVARELGLSKVPVLMKKIDGNEDFIELALIENIQREDLNPLERAKGYQSLIVDFGLSQDEVAEKVGKDRSTISNSIRLLDLENEIKDMIISGKLNFGQARALLAIDDPKERLKCARLAVSQSLTVRRLEDISRRGRRKEMKKQVLSSDIHIKEAEEKLRESLQTKVSIREARVGRGKIEIEYFSVEERERLFARLFRIFG